MSKKRKYDESYVKYGFCCMKESDDFEKPQCFLCGKVLANASMKPEKLIEHLKSLHPENASKDLEFFTKKKAQFSKSGTLTKLGFGIPQKPLVEASFRVAYRIAKSKKPHTIGETLIKPCALEMVELVCGLEQRKKLEAIPLSNDVIQSRIVEISCNILKQIINELKASPFPFSMQLDETTDISNCSQLLVFVRYVSADTIKEEFLFCEPLLQTTKAVDVLAILNVFFSKHDFDWKQKLHSLCTDGAPAMLGNKSGFAHLGPDTTIMDATEKLQAFLSKMSVWKIRIQNGIYANFQMLDEFIFENGSRQDSLLLNNLKDEICEHLEVLQVSFEKYFNLDEITKKDELWIRNPFLCDIDCIDDMDLAKDELIDLKTKSLLKMDFDSKTLGEFWSSLREAYPLLVKRAMAAIIPFATQVLLVIFSAMDRVSNSSPNPYLWVGLSQKYHQAFF
ncbi:protein ZBED8 [Nephila pilipes]|uniref:Protein ZBED8 n=1 Tax=Nephila pilipes TaxID=299642 RepID=A0A8X6NBV5_NEPPI|nr:protein ZBED8 [Nephila pilipes]